MSKIRTFIAIEISDSVHEKIARVQEKLKRSKERISWTRPQNIHLTLKFLGDVEESNIESIENAVKIATEDIRLFTAQVKKIGAFPNFKRPRVLWVGIENNVDIFRKIVHNLEDELHNLGFHKENRKFSPHLTIGRVKSALSRQFVETVQNYHFEGGEIPINEIVVMKSDLKPTGAIYTPLKKIKLSE